jgi:hypothetical protein
MAIAEYPRELQKRLSQYKYCDGSPVFQYKEEPKKKLPRHPERLESRYLDTDLTELGNAHDADFQVKLTQKIFENGGALLTGAGGTGKTYLINSSRRSSRQMARAVGSSL